MAADTHYEVFVKKNRKAAWTLHEAQNDREMAIRLAHDIFAQNKIGSVRVTKEVYDEEARTFRSVPICELGEEKFAEDDDKNGTATLPCLTPEDLSKPHARDTIRRVLTAWFERLQALPMELLHRPDLVEQLEASGTDLQHAVQKVAIASAKDGDANVHGYVKQLNELIQQALTRIYQDARAQRLPEYPDSKPFKDIVNEIHAGDQRAYLLRSAMAARLKSAKRYSDKLEALMDMAGTLGEDSPVRDFALTEIDNYAAEVISFDAGMTALLGSCRDLGETLQRLACLFDGDEGADAINFAPNVCKRLTISIGKGEMDACRAVVAQSLLTELQRPKRLRPSSLPGELRLARELAQKLVMSPDSLLPTDALIKAFAARSARLLHPETIDELLKGAADSNEELERLLALEENLVGEANKQKLAGYAHGLLGSQNMLSWYLRGPNKPLERLAALTAHQRRVLKGQYPAREKAELAGAIDGLGMKVIDESKILNAVEAGDRPALDKATGLLRLATAGALPTGQCSSDAQARAMRHLKSAEGMSEAQTEDGRAKLKLIQTMLVKMAPRANAA
ncbi:hypothetical protein [Maricaulis salignorans]|uniref:Uncharacterized protein n=1 Tax=Maricaulis salignorans TaxID=144026 RepID=A0A1G9SU47_9PROT|nr:hypothetical protein [Maricaulis salignorans]SDM38950.1 hypothetical protein SAMN04488568_11074 [Maricaulis salignorans]